MHVQNVHRVLLTDISLNKYVTKWIRPRALRLVPIQELKRIAFQSSTVTAEDVYAISGTFPFLISLRNRES